MKRPSNNTNKILHHLLLLVILLLPKTALSFQHHRRPVDVPGRHHHEPEIPRNIIRSVALPDRDAQLETSSSNRDHQSSLSVILLSALFFLGVCGTPPQPANAAEEATTVESIITELTKIRGTSSTDALTKNPPSSSNNVGNYVRQVFTLPDNKGVKPVPMDPKLDSKEARNRAYDEAFDQDARDRDAYYGQMAILKRGQALQDVNENRRDLGLDGDGDVRLRVGEPTVAGIASLKEYLLQQDPSTLTSEEFKVYQQMKGEQ